MSVPCARCGLPIEGVAPNRNGERFYHGECWRLEHPPADPAVPIQSESQDYRDGLDWNLR